VFVPRTEVIPLPTITLTDEQFLLGRHDGVPHTIAGVLRIPRIDAGRLPAVVLVHGSGGLGSNIPYWEQSLNTAGIATFALDVFSGRGINSTIDDQEQLGRLPVIVDVYRALDVLATRPLIDADRVALMGFSRGAQVTLYASVTRFQRMHATSGREFVAYLPFYPSCAITFIDDGIVTKRPIRVFHGVDDDWVPISYVREYVARLKTGGADVELHEYAGALHAFDAPSRVKPEYYPNAATPRNIRMTEIAPGRLVDPATGEPFTWNDPRIERGAHAGYNQAAAAAATRDVLDFLADTFRLSRHSAATDSF
jgi:dienelactone hydrolase